MQNSVRLPRNENSAQSFCIVPLSPLFSWGKLGLGDGVRKIIKIRNGRRNFAELKLLWFGLIVYFVHPVRVEESNLRFASSLGSSSFIPIYISSLATIVCIRG